jgi:deazaflavin-dependent oxidoreductase (nitroreductase family)
MWFNPIMIGLLRSPLHGLVDKNMMLLNYNGRKSGTAYTLPVNYVRQDNQVWVMSQRDRTWWRNLRGGVPVSVLIRGQWLPGMAAAIEDDETVVESLTQFLQAAPQMARYLKIALDEQGQPDQTAVAEAAADRVMVEIQLQSR